MSDVKTLNHVKMANKGPLLSSSLCQNSRKQLHTPNVAPKWHTTPPHHPHVSVYIQMPFLHGIQYSQLKTHLWKMQKLCSSKCWCYTTFLNCTVFILLYRKLPIKAKNVCLVSSSAPSATGCGPVATAGPTLGRSARTAGSWFIHTTNEIWKSLLKKTMRGTWTSPISERCVRSASSWEETAAGGITEGGGRRMQQREEVC